MSATDPPVSHPARPADDGRRTGEPNDGHRQPGGEVRGRARVVVLCAGLLVVALTAVALAVLSWANRDSAAREAARADALAAGPGLVESVLGYNSPSVDADLDRAAQATTGDFHDRFAEYATTTVAPQSKAQGTSTRARVVDTGFLDGTADHVRLLMFVDQITTSTAQPAPASTTSRIEVGLTLVDGTWRVSELTPV